MVATGSTTFRMVQLSDTHLSATHAYFEGNWCAALAEVRSAKPDLILHSGDVSFNGAAHPGDLQMARAAMDNLPCRWRVVAGNHDIGESHRVQRLGQNLNSVRLAVWQQNFGSPWWFEDFGAWRFIGCDSQLMASDAAECQEQEAFLATALAEREGREAFVLMHMPPFIDDPENPEYTTAALPIDVRKWFLGLCLRYDVRVVASGHMHVHRAEMYGNTEFVWAPTTAMVAVRRQWKSYRQFVQPGYLDWAFDGRHYCYKLITPELMSSIDMSSWTKHNGGTTTTLPPRPLNPFYRRQMFREPAMISPDV